MIDSCPECHGVWLDRGEFDSITTYLRDEATNATPKEIAEELRDDLKKVATGEGPESRLAELGDAAAAVEALANTVVFDHPALFKILTRTAGAGRGAGLD